jgi:hypothetical protein
LSLAPDLEQVYLVEMGGAILGIARCLVIQKEHRAALDLLEDLYSMDMFKSISEPAINMERERLLVEIHEEMGD